jgi:hypothetical protein
MNERDHGRCDHETAKQLNLTCYRFFRRKQAEDEGGLAQAFSVGDTGKEVPQAAQDAWQALHSFEPSTRVVHDGSEPLENFPHFLSAWRTWPDCGIDVDANHLPLPVLTSIEPFFLSCNFHQCIDHLILLHSFLGSCIGEVYKSRMSISSAITAQPAGLCTMMPH